MARVGEFDLKGARIVNRDFAGEKFGTSGTTYT